MSDTWRREAGEYARSRRRDAARASQIRLQASALSRSAAGKRLVCVCSCHRGNGGVHPNQKCPCKGPL